MVEQCSEMSNTSFSLQQATQIQALPLGSGKRRERWWVSWQDGMQQVLLSRVYNQLYTTSSSIPFPATSGAIGNKITGCAMGDHRMCIPT